MSIRIAHTVNGASITQPTILRSTGTGQLLKHLSRHALPLPYVLRPVAMAAAAARSRPRLTGHRTDLGELGGLREVVGLLDVPVAGEVGRDLRHPAPQLGQSVVR